MFGGTFDPEKLPFPINRLAGQQPVSEIRDWAMIRGWAGELAAKLARASTWSSRFARGRGAVE